MAKSRSSNQKTHNSNQTKSRSYSPRQSRSKQIRKRFLIVCEGTKTEPNYFESFRQKLTNIVSITIRAAGKVTLSLVKEAKKIKDEDGEYDEVWCVFDRDAKAENKNQQNFNEAIELACNNDIKLAISNDSFELWYLLHFEYYSSQTHRSQFESLLSDRNRLGEKYEKNCDNMYDRLIDLQSKAIQNAERLWNSYNQNNSITDRSQANLIQQHNNNPSTTVFLLVQSLDRYLDRS
jgi:RloB-like protein